MDVWQADDVASPRDNQIGGLAAPTTFPMRPGQALDVYYNGSKDTEGGVYDAGYYRGVIDKVWKPTPTGIQKVRVDYPDEFTHDTVELTRGQLYKPGTQPEQPAEEDGEVAVEVAAADLPGVDDSTRAYGLTEEQLATLKDLWYEQGHYSGVTRMWSLLKQRAEAAGAQPTFGIRNRQLRSWIGAQESKQLFKPVNAPKTYRPFELPSEPLRNLQMDTLDLGAYGGLKDAKQRWVQVIVDPATRYVWAMIHGGKSVKASKTIAGLVAMLGELRDGPLKHDAASQFNVFAADGSLLRKLRIATDSGSEFRPGSGRTFDDAAWDELSRTGLARDRSMFKAKYNLGQAPNQAAFVERMNSTIRQKLRLAVQAEQGTIQRTTATKERQRVGWKKLLARAVAAINDEVASATGKTPNEAMKSFVAEGPPTPAEGEPLTQDQQRKVEARRALEKQKKMTVGTRVRLVNLAREKAELLGRRKMETRWSEQVFEVDRIIKRGADTDAMAYEYQIRKTNGQAVKGTYKREQLQVIPALETEYVRDTSQKGLSKKLSEDGTIPRLVQSDGTWKSVLDGSSWAEKQVATLTDDEVGTMSRAKVMWRLVAYLRQGNTRDIAFKRLKDSLAAPDPSKVKVAILSK